MGNKTAPHEFLKYDNVILASKSPRRLDILNKHGIYPIIAFQEVDEIISSDMDFCEVVKALSLKKALAATKLDSIRTLKGFFLLIASDTVVYKDEIMGKPVDKNDAIRMLRKIRNTNHQVASGVTLIEIKDGIPDLDNAKSFAELTDITCTDYSDEQILEYISSGEPFDKAGSYAIQGLFGKYIKEFNGDYENVVGLPFTRIIHELKSM